MVVTVEKSEEAQSEKEESINFFHFAYLNQISPINIDKTYQAVPKAGIDKAFQRLGATLSHGQSDTFVKRFCFH